MNSFEIMNQLKITNNTFLNELGSLVLFIYHKRTNKTLAEKIFDAHENGDKMIMKKDLNSILGPALFKKLN